MNKESRSAIERTTQKARRLLEQELAEQMAGTFGVMQDGCIDEEASGSLKQKQKRQRTVILAAIDHKRLSGMKPAQAVADYMRDAAFTILNRFVALKMLERRGLVQECISKGEASAGWAEFTSFAVGLRLPDGSGYRNYIESLFDELSTEIKVLFDRREPAGVLWPRKDAFDLLIGLLNTLDTTSAWDEDETIGWVYQYFNTGDERRAMRDASQAPRNGRELAIRNQFFTPNYVVRFLVDNTLGRLWFDMRQGQTQLAQQCEYMTRWPEENFAPPEDQLPNDEPPEGLTLDQMWRRPISVRHRNALDPRSIRVLDPACGSGHFLLGAFNLLLTIYVEAWADASGPVFDETGRTLREDYPDYGMLERALPALILRHNLFGVDIDPRCGQIAQLSLWMRAQRAFSDLKVSRLNRPRILRSNIVIAEAMPGNQTLLDDFLCDLKEDRLEALLQRALGLPSARQIRATKAMAESLSGLVETVWDELRLAGEMGLLIRIENRLGDAIRRGQSNWQSQLPLLEAAAFQLTDSGILDGCLKPALGSDTDFWSKGEQIVLYALKEYALNVTEPRRRLFSEDAAQGFALADICSKKYDVVLMNPPFGAGSASAKAVFERAYPMSKNDLYAAFVERGIEMLKVGGRLGALTSRTGLFLSSFQKWREQILLKRAPPVVIADLGSGVLDSAMVETAAYALERII